jgi:hypothetical protein
MRVQKAKDGRMPGVHVKLESDCWSYIAAQLSGKWFNPRTVELLTGANARSVRRWLSDWAKAGRLDKRTINSRAKQYRVHGSMPEDLPPPVPGEEPAPILPISQAGADAVARARELVPDMIAVLKDVAEHSTNPRAAMRATKSLMEYAHGQAPDARQIGSDDVKEIEQS